MKIVVTEFVTLDGVIEGPGPVDPFEHAGWSMPFWHDQIGAFKRDELFAADAQLLGRRTYEGFAAAWPAMKDPDGFADRMNAMPKYVASTTLTTLSWNNSQRIQGDVAAEVAKLRAQPGRDVLVAGSGELVRSLLQASLVDELRLLVYPVAIGSGKRLFDGAPRTALTLAEARTFPSGVFLLRHERA